MSVSRFINLKFDLLRAWPWLFLAGVMTVFIGITSPHQLGVLLWILTKVSLAAFLGYWIYRSLHPYARVHELTGEERRNAMLVRAIYVGAAIIALGLGL
ncbi:putative holin [Desulfonatronovibrio hydrogenovorans]|uniref:putative holin n=1 Tax=Desulfonatronovibrio hydrogenovorans TaxID=53245 RepID=UPI00068A6A4A|nr:putative holin [Desulfonatronovibrio hydrogenovorans]